MKQHTTPDQTAKLILMGMPKPHGTTEHQELVNKVWVTVSETHGDYTIGQLLDFLPTSATQNIRYVATKRAWTISVDVLGRSNDSRARCYISPHYPLLIDALYDMCVKLKAEGVI